MKGRKLLSLTGLYLKRNRTVITAGVCGGILCAAVFWLYRLPVEAVLYAWILGAVPGLLLSIRSFSRYCKKCGDLERMAAQKTGYAEPFEETSDQLELLYRRLLASSYEERDRLLREEEEKRTEMKDYYTMWVHQVKTPIAAMNLILQTHPGGGTDHSQLSNELFKVEQYVEWCFSTCGRTALPPIWSSGSARWTPSSKKPFTSMLRYLSGKRSHSITDPQPVWCGPMKNGFCSS